MDVPIFASDQLEVNWNQVCRTAAGREPRLTTTGGEKVSGYCVSVDGNEIRVTSGDQVIEVARATLAKLTVERAKGHQVRALRGVQKGLADAFNSLFSPAAPFEIAVKPGTLAWGEGALPFCVLGDIRSKVRGKQGFKPI